MAETLTVRETGPELVCLEGELTMSTVDTMLTEGGLKIRPGVSLQVDLSGVTRCDSVGLAALVEWCRMARRRDASVSLVRAPAQLLGLAATSNLQFLFSESA